MNVNLPAAALAFAVTLLAGAVCAPVLHLNGAQRGTRNVLTFVFCVGVFVFVYEVLTY